MANAPQKHDIEITSLVKDAARQDFDALAAAVRDAAVSAGLLSRGARPSNSELIGLVQALGVSATFGVNAAAEARPQRTAQRPRLTM